MNRCCVAAVCGPQHARTNLKKLLSCHKNTLTHRFGKNKTTKKIFVCVRVCVCTVQHCVYKNAGFQWSLTHVYCNRAAGEEAAGCFNLPTLIYFIILFIAIYGVRITVGHVKYIGEHCSCYAPVMVLVFNSN